MSAQPVEAFYISVSHFDALSVGLNCAVGVDLMRPEIETLAGICRTRISCYPNAGLPDGFGGFKGDRDHTAAALGEFARNGWLNLVGGCCGTMPDWIHAIAEAVKDVPPRKIPDLPDWSCYSGMEALVVRPETNFIMIGERTNITGSKRFARLIKEGNFEAALTVAREQVENGANIIDVNMDAGLIDSEEAMTRFLNLVSADPAIAKVPIMIDSSKWSVIEAGLKCVQGKGIVNSISLKEGEEKFLHQARLVKRYGAAVVVMAFDEEGQAVTADNKVAISARAYKLLTEQVGFRPSDIIFDVNILTVGTGMEEHSNYAVEFFEAVRRLKADVPGREDQRRRQQRVVRLPRQRERGDPRGDERGVFVPRHPGRPRHGHRQRRPVAGLRGDPEGPAGARRGRAAQPPAGRHGTAGRVLQDHRPQGEDRGPATGVARVAGGGTAETRPGPGHRRPHRRGRGGVPTSV